MSFLGGSSLHGNSWIRIDNVTVGDFSVGSGDPNVVVADTENDFSGGISRLKVYSISTDV